MNFSIFEVGSLWRHTHTDAILEIITNNGNTLVFKNTKQVSENTVNESFFQSLPLELFFSRKTKIVELLYL